MLSNHLLASYSDIQNINWTEVAKKTEFACHTANSLKNRIFHNLYKNTARKLYIPLKEVTLSQVAEYSKDLYSHGRKTRKNILKSQMLLVDYFEKKVSKLKLTNLIKLTS